MRRLLAGTLLGGAVLFAWSAVSGTSPSCRGAGLAGGSLLSAFLATLLLLQLGPRSLVEKVLFLLTAAVLAWSGRAGSLADLADALAAWTLTGSALAWLTRPRAE